MERVVLACDIGGSHISSALVGVESGTVVQRSRAARAVDSAQGAEHILEVWAQALQDSLTALGKHELAGLGCAMPSPFDYRQGLGAPSTGRKYESLEGVKVGDALRSALNVDPGLSVRFINDATAFAVGEAWRGATAPYRRSVALTLGTGLGSAFIHNGVPVLEGAVVPPQGCLWHLPCHHGLADDFFSTRGFVAEYAAVSGQTVSGVRALADRAREGDDSAVVAFRRRGKQLGEFVGPWLKGFGAESLVVGGNIAKAYTLWGPAMEHALEASDFAVDVRFSTLHEDAAVVGAARLLDEQFWQSIEHLIELM
ncbi:MAG: ROK family protein [Spirochaetaceae bacterium]|nr:MAG: ROK family protein [Spirochaetaceae bacterium]